MHVREYVCIVLCTTFNFVHVCICACNYKGWARFRRLEEMTNGLNLGKKCVQGVSIKRKIVCIREYMAKDDTKADADD